MFILKMSRGHAARLLSGSRRRGAAVSGRHRTGEYYAVRGVLIIGRYFPRVKRYGQYLDCCSHYARRRPRRRGPRMARAGTLVLMTKVASLRQKVNDQGKCNNKVHLLERKRRSSAPIMLMAILNRCRCPLERAGTLISPQRREAVFSQRRRHPCRIRWVRHPILEESRLCGYQALRALDNF